MGYYDNQQVASFTGRNAPYDVKDILLGTNAVTGGVDKLVANAAADRVYNQQQQANQYISSLMSNTNTDNYDANMAKMRTLAPFASPQMIAQLQGLTTDINNKNNLGINQQKVNAMQQDSDTNRINSTINQQKADNENDYQKGSLANQLLSINNTRDYQQGSLGNQLIIGKWDKEAKDNATGASIGNNIRSVGMEKYKTDAMVGLGTDKLKSAQDKASRDVYVDLPDSHGRKTGDMVNKYDPNDVVYAQGSERWRAQQIAKMNGGAGNPTPAPTNSMGSSIYNYLMGN
jgi:hypothetical protein